jgi:hypothetical protein
MPIADPVKRAEYNRKYRERNRAWLTGKASEHWHTVQKFRVKENRELRRRRRYGITNAEWDVLFASQGGLCAICRTKPPVDVDHHHGTGEIRGLLCRGCNVGLGQLGDSIEGLQRAIEYLRKDFLQGGK